MAKAPADLSQFKKISGDKEKTVLRHPDGHTLTIAHGPLSAKMRKQFEDLPTIKHYADGTDDVQQDNQPQQQPQSAPTVVINTGSAPAPQVQAPPTQPAPPQQMAPTPAPQEPQTEGFWDSAKRGYHELKDALTPKEPAPAAPAPAANVPPPATMPQASSPQGGMMDNYAKMVQGGVQQQMAGIDAGAKAASDLGNTNAEIRGNQVATDQQQIDLSNVANAAANQEREHFIADIKAGHINPNRMMENTGSGQKVMNAIGLMLSGGGSGITGGPNLAYDYLNKQIDRDIKSQETNLHSDENLLANNLEQFKNSNVARQMLRVQYNDMYSHMIDTAAAQNAGPAALATAKQLKGQLQAQNAMIMSQIGAGSSGSMGDMLQMMRMVNPEKAKEMESRYVPGVGMSQIPITPEVRNKLLAHQQMDKMATDLYSWASKHSGAAPGTKEAREGATKAAELQSAYRASIDGGVFKKGEQEFIDNIIDSDPTKFFNKVRVLPALQTVIKSNRSKMGMLMNSYGFNGSAPQQQQASIPFKPIR